MTKTLLTISVVLTLFLNSLSTQFERAKLDHISISALSRADYNSIVERVTCYPERKNYSESCMFIICRRPAETQGCDWVYGEPKGAISSCFKKTDSQQ